MYVKAVAIVGLLLIVADPAGASVSSTRQSCIRGAMEAGSAALGNPTRLSKLYEHYFEGERIAQMAAGRDWKRYTEAQRDAQRSRVRRFVVGVLAPSFSRYGGSKVEFLSESGSKVKGAVIDPHGQRQMITWHFIGECRFVNLSIDGYGSLISFVGREPTRN
jgi:hypothetical protein